MNWMIALALPFFVLTMAVEWALLRHHDEHVGYDVKDSATSLSMGIGYLVISTVSHFILAAGYLAFYHFRVSDLGGHWATWVLAFVLYDFLFYWMHRAGHEVRFMWASHVNHHSSDHYNLSTALRQSWTEHFFAWGFWWPLALFGLPFEAFIVIGTVNLLYQYWLHTELIRSMGPFGWVFNTPAFHRVHHGVNLEYLDKNYAAVFIVWDRLFGTFEPEVAPVRYGITTPLESNNPVTVAFHEWAAMLRDVRDAKTWRGRLGVVFKPPGWRENGEHETVRAMIEAEARAEATP